MILHFILVLAVAGEIILETVWDIEECSGQPTAITMFPAANASALWLAWQDNYLYPYCGCDYIPLHTGCCISSIDLSQSYGYHSATYVVDNDNISPSDYWKDSNGKYFCEYSAINGGQLDWGYLTRYLKPNGICYDGMVCIDSELQAYANTDCSGSFESFNLTRETEIFHSTIFGTNINAAFTTIEGGQSNTVWITYFPMAILVPEFQVPAEIIGICSYTLALALSLYAAYRDLLRVLRNAKGSLFLFVAQTMWIIWVVLNIMDWTYRYQSVFAYQFTEALLSALYSLSTLFSTITTVSLILDYYTIKAAYQRKITFTILIFFHLALAGGGYMYFISYFDLTAWVFTYWYYLFPVWNLLFFLLNTIPPILILGKIGYLYGYVKDISSKLKIYTQLMPLQFGNTVLYMILVSILQFTQLLGNDRNSIAWNGPMSLTMIVHEVLNYWIKNFVHRLLVRVDTEYSKELYASKLSDDHVGGPPVNSPINSKIIAE
ncbi:hypothetical protein HDV01_006424 [Terramyces sp. JEL0728]|nr:hypothetical protein HDV01_006424 [Terramyces sp. JEL0728]